MNIITIAGTVTRDSELRALGDGTPVLSFSVADNQAGRDKPAIYWNCSLFGKRGESLQQYINKGQSVTVSGNVSEREYVNKDGQKVKATDVRVNDVALQGGKRDSGEQSAPRQAAPAKPRTGGDSGFSDMDAGDIPFANPMRGAAKCLAM